MGGHSEKVQAAHSLSHQIIVEKDMASISLAEKDISRASR
jgi:hypothetical protein